MDEGVELEGSTLVLFEKIHRFEQPNISIDSPDLHIPELLIHTHVLLTFVILIINFDASDSAV